MTVLSQEEWLSANYHICEALGFHDTDTVSGLLGDQYFDMQVYGFGEIWSRPALSLRERCFITLAALAAAGHTDMLGDYVLASAKIGIDPEDILESLFHLGVYAGLPKSQDAMKAAHVALARRPGGHAVAPAAHSQPMSREVRTAAYARVVRDLGIGRLGVHESALPLQPLPGGPWSVPAVGGGYDDELKAINGAYGYGEVWGRQRLGYRVRSFVTMAVLQTLMQNDQLHFHINNALNIGVTSEELHEALAHVGVYAGLSGWQNATNVARDVLNQRQAAGLHPDDGSARPSA